MIELFTTGLICGTIIYVVLQAKQLVEKVLVQQKEGNEAKASTVPQRIKEPMPVHMLAIAFEHSEEWARTDMLKRMHELYDQYGDWEKVASAVSPRTN